MSSHIPIVPLHRRSLRVAEIWTISSITLSPRHLKMTETPVLCEMCKVPMDAREIHDEVIVSYSWNSENEEYEEIDMRGGTNRMSRKRICYVEGCTNVTQFHLPDVDNNHKPFYICLEHLTY